MLLSEQLRKTNLDLWDKTHIKHPFVNAIKDGSLTINKFRYYMIQDYKFLIEYCKVIAIAISKAEKLPIMSYWSKLLDETLNSEMKIHEDFCKDFGINDYELFDSEMSYETNAYCNHLLTIAYKYDINIIACSLLPCQWGYDYIGRELGKQNNAKKGSFHLRWIDSYNNLEYQQATEWLKDFVDSSEKKLNKELANKVFKESLEFEYFFWDRAWNEK